MKTKRSLSAKSLIKSLGAERTMELLNNFLLTDDGVQLSDEEGLIISNYMQFANHNFDNIEMVRKFVFINMIEDNEKY